MILYPSVMINHDFPVVSVPLRGNINNDDLKIVSPTAFFNGFRPLTGKYK